MSAATAQADWTTQTIRLNPGWNAVFLEVQPDPVECENVFSSLGVESVWAWNGRSQSVQYVVEPEKLVPDDPNWLVFMPGSDPRSFLNTLHAVHGGRAYLIKLKGAETVEWVVSGAPVVRSPGWVADSFNLAGFHVDPASPPTFSSFFSGSAAHAGQAVYRLSVSGDWAAVDTASARIERGVAYWMYCKGQSQYAGPVSLNLRDGMSLSYGSGLTELTMRVKNESSAAKTIQLRQTAYSRPTARPRGATADSEVTVGATVPLYVFQMDMHEKTAEWSSLHDTLSLDIGAKSERDIRVAVRRAAISAPKNSQTTYQSILEVADGQGSLYKVPVSVTKNASRAGLWSGTVTVNAVSEAGNAGDWVTPRFTPTEFQFRLITHVGADDVVKLLQQVIIMRVAGTFMPDPDNPELQIPDEPMRYVLLTRDNLIGEFTGVQLRDGEPAGRRISSPAFGFSEPIEMAGAFLDEVSCAVEMGYNDPLNPFVHRYNPDHDNLDERYERDLGPGRESYDIKREITLKFTEEDPEGYIMPNWGDDQIGGIYREKLSGMHRNPIYIQGVFRLQQVSRVGVLNDGL